MDLTTIISKEYFQRRYQKLQSHYTEPLILQEELLQRLLYKASQTVRGKYYDYRNIHSIHDFQNNVPVSSYDDLYPFITRTYNGEPNVLWPGLCKLFAMSSGTTTGASKYLPLSSDLLKYSHYKGGQDLFAFYVHSKPHTTIFGGKTLALGGSQSPHPSSSGVIQGDLSGIITKKLNFFAQYFRALDKKTDLTADWNVKLDTIASKVHKMDIRALVGIPSWWQLFLEMFMERHSLQDLQGIWPNLQLFVHGGIALHVYRDFFTKLFSHYSHDVDFIEVYNASEGFFAVADSVNAEDMLLTLDHGVFFEFEHHETKKIHTLGQVQLGETYEMLISTCAGMWRYRVGDMIRFTSLSPFRIQIVGRTKSYLNTFGEHVSVSNVDDVIASACTKFGCRVKEYMIGSYKSDNGEAKHHWVVEWAVAPENSMHFMKFVDQLLQERNDDYATMRSVMLEAPELFVVQKNAFTQRLEQRQKLGGQAKIPRLVKDSTFIKELLVYT